MAQCKHISFRTFLCENRAILNREILDLEIAQAVRVNLNYCERTRLWYFTSINKLFTEVDATGGWNEAITVFIDTTLDLNTPDPTILFADVYTFSPETFRQFLDESTCSLCKNNLDGMMLPVLEEGELFDVFNTLDI